MLFIGKIRTYFLKTQVMLGFFVAVVLFSAAPVLAQVNRSYSYDAIDYKIQINTDTTVTVAETQTYRFVGEYHQGWRNIPKKDFDALTDVSVTDAAGKPFMYSPKRLEKTRPDSWGKYTTFYKDGEYVIEWYYDARDTTRTWVLRYTLHGALAFYDNHDELYWNLFTNYTVPIESVDVEVLLPRAVENGDLLRESLYVQGANGKSGSRHSSDTFYFFANSLRPGATVTIAPGWPKGLVDTSSFWRWFIWHHIFIIFSVLLVLFSLIGGLLYWYFTERRAEEQDGPVIPEYEPPKNLRPAMASVIVYERVVRSVWAATLVDLAIRGHINIQEKQPTLWLRFRDLSLGFKRAFFGILFVGFVVWVVIAGMPIRVALIFWGIPVLIIVFQLRRLYVAPRTFILERIENLQDPLEDYEQKLLRIFFRGGKGKTDLSQRQSSQIFSNLQALKSDLCQETEIDTGVYERGFMVKEKKKYTLFISVGILVSLLLIFSFVESLYFQAVIFIVTLYWCVLGLWWLIYYDARLSHEGRLLKKDWLGFRLYLETAERYRLQNLTPETFEKYLPYAMLFGIEKQWGKAFDSIVVDQPHWYRSAPGLSNVSKSQFSPSLFSASFSSAVSSVISPSSSSGSGASGGGGSSGGGGGGGGGGAS